MFDVSISMILSVNCFISLFVCGIVVLAKFYEIMLLFILCCDRCGV